MKYSICVQFLNNETKFTGNIKNAISDAIANYNSRSLIAKNPKQIVGHSYSEDEMTLNLVLDSEAELPMPSKVLRLFSSYLVEKRDLKEDDTLLSEFKGLSVDEKLNVIYSFLLEKGTEQ